MGLAPRVFIRVIWSSSPSTPVTFFGVANLVYCADADARTSPVRTKCQGTTTRDAVFRSLDKSCRPPDADTRRLLFDTGRGHTGRLVLIRYAELIPLGVLERDRHGRVTGR